MPVDLLVCVVPLLGKVVVANKREGLKMAEFEKCAFFKDIIKYHGNNDCYDDDDVDGTWHMAHGKGKRGGWARRWRRLKRRQLSDLQHGVTLIHHFVKNLVRKELSR